MWSFQVASIRKEYREEKGQPSRSMVPSPVVPLAGTAGTGCFGGHETGHPLGRISGAALLLQLVYFWCAFMGLMPDSLRGRDITGIYVPDSVILWQ